MDSIGKHTPPASSDFKILGGDGDGKMPNSNEPYNLSIDQQLLTDPKDTVDISQTDQAEQKF